MHAAFQSAGCDLSVYFQHPGIAGGSRWPNEYRIAVLRLTQRPHFDSPPTSTGTRRTPEAIRAKLLLWRQILGNIEPEWFKGVSQADPKGIARQQWRVIPCRCVCDVIGDQNLARSFRHSSDVLCRIIHSFPRTAVAQP
jgi:hypothetical protein